MARVERAVLHPLHVGHDWKAKGIQRDPAAMPWRWPHRSSTSTARAGETFFATSDIGWAVGHSYVIYGPLIAGIDHCPVRRGADPSGRGRLVEDRPGYQGRVMFSAPTAIRVLKKQDPS